MCMPGIGKPTTTALLTAIDNIEESSCDKQLVKLAGLNIGQY
ncbi:transposase [Thermodesulfobacteriota bacterium]